MRHGWETTQSRAHPHRGNPVVGTAGTGSTKTLTIQLCVLVQDKTVLVALAIGHAGLGKFTHHTLDSRTRTAWESTDWYDAAANGSTVLSCREVSHLIAAASACRVFTWYTCKLAHSSLAHLGAFVHKVQGALVIGLFKAVGGTEPEWQSSLK